jgi:hypothetical protein
MFSWIASYRQLLREVQAKAAQATDPAEKAAFERQAKQWEGRLKEEEARAASNRHSGNGAKP